ncbi:MAG: fumarate hydratase [Methanosarcinales archaeon]|nr:fumarate hydratase [Methanosarcinales archaeon]
MIMWAQRRWCCRRSGDSGAMKFSVCRRIRVVGCRRWSIRQEILEGINSLGIGTMGLGGDITALAVHIEYSYCHTASLPVAVNIQCWANRRASMEL